MTTIELSDEWHQDEPMAYLVANHDTVVQEYKIFNHEASARHHADRQQRKSRRAGEEKEFPIFPLYAGHPIK